MRSQARVIEGREGGREVRREGGNEGGKEEGIIFDGEIPKLRECY